MNLSDYQVMYGDLLMGPGTTYDVDWEQLPLLDAPPLKTSDNERARGDGAWRGEVYSSSQTFLLSLKMFGWAGIDVGVAFRTFMENTTPGTPRDLWFKVPHLAEPRCLVAVEARRRAVPVTRLFKGKISAEVDLFAADPVRYGAEATATAVAGVTTMASGVNAGDRNAVPVFYLSHPTGITEPIQMRHVETGSYISIDTTTGPGEVLRIDPRTGTAIVDYIDDRGGDLQSREWWSVPPHKNFRVRLYAQDGVRMDVVWRSSWW